MNKPLSRNQKYCEKQLSYMQKKENIPMNQYKILLVEDDAEISEMLRNYLTAENYDVCF